MGFLKEGRQAPAFCWAANQTLIQTPWTQAGCRSQSLLMHLDLHQGSTWQSSRNMPQCIQRCRRRQPVAEVLEPSQAAKRNW